MRGRGRGLAPPLVALAAAVALAACASRVAPPSGVGEGPFGPGADERTLRAAAGREAAALEARLPVVDDARLAAYLAGLAERLGAGAAGGPEIRVVVVRDPTLNAFALPGGRLFVHTGLLSAVQNEAQLAAILGREIAHVAGRHALAAARAARSTPALAVVASLARTISGTTAAARESAGAPVLGPTANVVLGLRLPLATLAAVDGYGADREQAADAGALERLVRAGYDPAEAPRAFRALRAEASERGAVETFLLGRPAALDARIRALEPLLAGGHAAAAGKGAVDSPEFAAVVRPVVRDNAAEEVRFGRFALARRQLDRVLAATPDDPVAHLHYGELYRLQAQRPAQAAEASALAARAAERYERAAALDPAYAAPHRQLGFLHYQRGDVPRARAAFARYLQLAPEAPDAPRVREYLAELTR